MLPRMEEFKTVIFCPRLIYRFQSEFCSCRSQKVTWSWQNAVEQSRKKNKRVYDFEDFCKAVADTDSTTVVKKMTVQDFYNFEDCSSSYKLQHSEPRAYLRNMSEITFRRGSNSMFYKNNHDTEEPKQLDFLKVKNLKIGIPLPKQKSFLHEVSRLRENQLYFPSLGHLCPITKEVFGKLYPLTTVQPI